MSVRRLAEASVQPASFAFNEANAAWAQQTIKKYPEGRQQSAVIPLLMRAQEQDGWITKSAIEYVADMLDMPYIRVLEVATFYTQFQLKPVGTSAHVQVCGTTPCMLRGSEDLMRVCREKIHPEPHHCNETGTLSWEEVECLGACVNAPMVMIFKDTYEDLTPERLAEIIDEFEAGRGEQVKTGPQTDRFFSAPATGFTSLTDETAVLKSTRDAQAQAAAATSIDPAQTQPSEAARPKTDAPETNPTLKSPSPVKVSPAVEAAASVATPKENPVAADKAADGEPREHSGKRPEGEAVHKAPEASSSEPAVSLEDPNRPTGIERPAQPDDLKLISGVGPQNEKLLNDLGIYTYGQVASWTQEQRAWVDGYLKFKGRIDREDWVKQAEALARGGVDEYVRVFGKKPR